MSRRIVAVGTTAAPAWADAGHAGTQVITLPVSAVTVDAVTGSVSGRQADDVVVVLGSQVPDPAAVVHRLRPGTSHLAVIIVGPPPAGGMDAVTLMIGERVRRIHEDQLDHVGLLLDELFQMLATRRRHRAMQAGAQAHLAAAGTRIESRLGERLFGELLSRAPIGAVLTGTATELLAWNARAADLLDLRDPGSLHTGLPALFDDPGAVAGYLATARYDAGDGTKPATFHRTAADGVTGHLRVTGQPSIDDTGRTRLLILIEDVTELVEAQRELTLRSQAAIASAQVAAALTAAESLDRKLHRCTEAITTHLGLTAAAIWTGGEGTAPSALRATSGAATGITDASEPAAVPSPGVLSYPLLSENQRVGVLSVVYPATADPAVLAPLPAIARQIAVGIRQDHLNDSVRAVAEALQRPLLPPTLPVIPNMDLAARYLPHGDGTRIGGDFYDAFALPDGRYVLALGDIRGKGPEAAAATGLVRHTIWTAAQHSPDPAYVLPLVNQALLRLGDARFCTLVYGLLSVGARGCSQLQLSCAGHPAPVIARNGTARLADSRGTLLGATPRLRLHSETIALTAGTAVVCYTDGFTEGGGVFSREPEDLAAEVGALPGGTLSAAAVADTLLNRAVSSSAGPVRDDLALLVAVAT